MDKLRFTYHSLCARFISKFFGGTKRWQKHANYCLHHMDKNTGKLLKEKQ